MSKKTEVQAVDEQKIETGPASQSNQSTENADTGPEKITPTPGVKYLPPAIANLAVTDASVTAVRPYIMAGVENKKGGQIAALAAIFEIELTGTLTGFGFDIDKETRAYVAIVGKRIRLVHKVTDKGGLIHWVLAPNGGNALYIKLAYAVGIGQITSEVHSWQALAQAGLHSDSSESSDSDSDSDSSDSESAATEF